MYLNPKNDINLSQDTAINQILQDIGQVRHINAQTFILQEGDPCDFFFFVHSGAFRAFRTVDTKEVTLGFTFAGDIDTCPFSYTNNLPSLDTIQALSVGKIIKVYKKDFLFYSKHQSHLESLTEYFFSSYIEILIQRTINFKLKTAEENYLALLQRQPNAVKEIPLAYIASYLGISPARLSRIRRKNRSELT